MELQHFLTSQGYSYPWEVVETIEARISAMNLNAAPCFLLRGPAGTGKTSLASMVAQWLQAKIIFFQCTQGTNEDDLLYKYLPSEHTKSGIKISLGPLPLALLSSKNQKTVLIIDEFDKTRPSTDALLLDFLQNNRLSLYLSEDETVVQGNAENLVVFLTSNDVREFSEPLLRRVIVLQLPQLSVSMVRSVLSRKFEKEIVELLVRIYIDTIKAGLRKPATIQELIELGRLIKIKPGMSLNTLVRSLIVKYEDDWQRYVDYVKHRREYSSNDSSGNDSDNDEDIAESYMNDDFQEDKEEVEKEEKKISVAEVLSRFMKKVEIHAEAELVNDSDSELTAIVENEDFEGYTNIIKTLKPEPSDNPAKLGKFRLINFEGTEFIVSKEPLSFDELKAIHDKRVKGEFYFEDTMQVLSIKVNDFVNKLVESATKIKYYTKHRLMLQEGYDSLLLDVQISDDKPIATVTVKGYLKYSGKSTLLSVLESYMINNEQVEQCYKDYFNGKINDLSLLPLANYFELKKDDKIETVAELFQKAVLLIKHFNLDAEITADSTYDFAFVINNKFAKIAFGYRAKNLVLKVIDKDKKYKLSEELASKIMACLRGEL